MCLLVLLHKVVPDYPLIVAANRDEDPARGGEPPFRWSEGFAAPRDPRAGGTWIGINPAGVLSVVTNRKGAPAPGPEVKSRGALPLEALKERTAFQAHRRAERIPTFLFSPFHWIYADTEMAFVVEHGGPSDLSVRLRPGLHVLSNVHDLNQVDMEAVRRYLSLDPAQAGIDDVLLKLQELLAVHEPLLSADHRICKHDGPPQTLSANIIAVHAGDRSKSRWQYHEGQPCRNLWKDVSALLV